LNDLNPQTSRLVLSVIGMAVMLAVTILAMRVVSRFLEPNDPRRAMAIRAVLWIATGILMAILLQLRQ
jgi:uncharacterized membrane protein YcfT